MARTRTLALATALTLLLPAVALSAPGDVDPTFGNGGVATLDWGGTDFAADVLVDPDQSIVVAGMGGVDEDLVVQRVSPAGSPDTGFFNSLSVTGDDEAYAMSRQADGKIVAAGFTEDNLGVTKGLVVRLNPDGTPDGSFGDGGIALIDAGGYKVVYDLAVQPDGKIVASGSGGPGNDGVVTRLTSQGLPDASFDGDGTAVLDFGGVDYAEQLALRPDGKVVIAGWTQNAGMWLARLNADGSPDMSFFGNGRRPLPLYTGDYSYDLLLQPDGKMVVIGGGTGQGFLVTRMTADGSFDGSFANGEGVTTINFGDSDSDQPWGGAVLQANGKLVVAGYTVTGASESVAVARLQPGGSLDTTFSADGLQTLPGTSSHAQGVALQADGRIVIAGDIGSDALLVRLEGDGLPAGGGPIGGNPGAGGGGGGVAQMPRCAGKKATIVGTGRSDRLKGTRRADVIVALGGNDRIAAGRGNDLICAGDGNDSIEGGTGNDRLFGQNGTDKLGGGDGTDSLSGGNGNDQLGGGSGKDSLSGGNGKDRLSGGGGRDGCLGGAGKDRATCERSRGV
jgi:uncharacterized delta-60 repeat protein